MSKYFNYFTAAIVSGILTFISVAYVTFFSTWFCFVPLFIFLLNADKKNAFRAGIIFGLTIALPSFYWMIPGAQRFTGSSSVYGVIVFIFSSLLLSLYFGFINYVFVYIRSKKKAHNYIMDALLISAIYTTAEALLMNGTTGMPWFGFHSGNGLLANIYTIQAAAVFGMHILSFIVVLVNYSIAAVIVSKQWKQIVIPVAIVCVYILSGYILYNEVDETGIENKPVKIAILNANIPPEEKWDANNGNKLVGILLNLDSIASLQKPDIILWSESAVPWTYRKDDDMVKEILRISSFSKPTQLLGMNSDYNDNFVYNSVYAIKPDGTVEGQYDKRYRLSFIEAPFAGFSFPFFSSSGFLVEKGTSEEPLQTAYGKAGVMICNESTLPQSASSMVNNGANFLVNLSNDGWFNDTYLVDLHFWNVKLRAVETRRDIAVNSNNGYTGLVHASGEVAMQEMGKEPVVKMVSANTNYTITLATKYPFLFVYICSLYVITIFILNMKQSKTVAERKVAAKNYRKHK